jgi:O-antigen/teichoic acid export membrane protein
MLRGSLWAIVMRWSLRGIGLISVLILARLLTPEDFGIVAMASITIGFIQGFSELGTSMVLIREPNPTRAHCDTAWTVQVIVGTFVATLVAALAEPAAWYFREPRLVAVLYLLAASALVGSTTNVGLVLVRKALDFATDFRFVVYTRLATFLITIPLALVLRSYWALVAGQVVGGTIGVWLSYRMHPYRPRLSLERAKEYFTFSLSIVPFNIARFLRDRIGVLVVGRIADTAALGSYNVAAELASMATQEIISPLGRALFPSYATLVGDRKKLVEVFLNVFAAITMLTVPIGVGLSTIAEEFVYVVLGNQWTHAIPFLQWLAIYGILNGWSFTLTGSILIVSGHERRSAFALWLYVAILVPFAVVGGWLWGALGVAQGATVASVVALPVMAHLLRSSLPVTFGQLVRAVAPYSAAGVLMAAVLVFVTKDTFGTRVIQLTMDVLVGAALYTSAIYGLWRLRGRPVGVEHAVLDLIAHRFNKTPPE